MLGANAVLSTRALMVCLALQAREPTTLQEVLASGDEHYAHRDEGASGARAKPARIERALSDYRRALSLDPGSLEARQKLLRALFFRASFCGAEEDEQRRIFEEARRIADEGIERLDKALGGPDGSHRLAVLRKVADSAQAHFWAAVSWGEWAQRRSRFTAARQGAAGRIRELAQTVIDLDPTLEEGGGYRILGRLHDLSPRIPLLTGWISRQAALENLRKAHALAPRNTVNRLFLAEAILRHDPARKAEAHELLRALAGATPSAAYRVEDAHFAELARRRLAELR